MDHEAIAQAINSIRSKYGIRILKLLYREGIMYHGDLAGRLEISPSALNAVIRKMNETGHPLIHTEVVGKFKKYSLPSDVKEYMDHAETGSDGQEPIKVNDGRDRLIPLMNYIDAADRVNTDWKRCMNYLLSGEGDDVPAPVQKAFDILIKQIETLYEEQSPDLKLIFKVIKNDVLIFLLEEYLQNME